MKKTLVALAVVAASGASFAQVTLSGNISFSQQNGYTSSNSATAMSDNSIFLSGSEDLGGGTTVSFSTGFDAGGRGTGGQEDSNLSIAGGFGKVTLTGYESHSPIDDNVLISGSAQNGSVHDTAAFGIKASNRMGAIYSTPAFNGLTGKVGYIRNQDGTNSKYVLGLTYVSGGLKVYVEGDSFDNTNYGKSSIINADGTATVVDPKGATATVAYVVYDAGSVKVALGYNKNSYDPNGTTAWGVSVPVGALSFGIDGASYNGAQLTEAGVGYALSKRTSIKLGVGIINDQAKTMSGALTKDQLAAGSVGAVLPTTTATTGPAWANNSQYRVGLFHSF